MNGIAGRGGEKFERGKKRKRGEIISALKKVDGEKSDSSKIIYSYT